MASRIAHVFLKKMKKHSQPTALRMSATKATLSKKRLDVSSTIKGVLLGKTQRPQGVYLISRSKYTMSEQREDYMSFYLKRSTWELICSLNGWKPNGNPTERTGAQEKFSKQINVSKQYISMMLSGKRGCSSNVMRKIIRYLNMEDRPWCHLFELHNTLNIDPNHPIYNSAKYMGEIPYTQYSHNGHARENDYSVEIEGHS